MSRLDATCSLACTYVGIGQENARMSMLALVVIVDYNGQILLCDYVASTEPITDWRTPETGLSEASWASLRERPVPLAVVQQRVRGILYDKTLIGHCLWTDLQALGLIHPASATRDVALYAPFRTAVRAQGSKPPRLLTLMHYCMSRTLGDHEDNAITKARSTMDLYRSASMAWEGEISKNSWPCLLPPATFSRCYK